MSSRLPRILVRPWEFTVTHRPADAEAGVQRSAPHPHSQPVASGPRQSPQLAAAVAILPRPRSRKHINDPAAGVTAHAAGRRHGTAKAGNTLEPFPIVNANLPRMALPAPIFRPRSSTPRRSKTW